MNDYCTSVIPVASLVTMRCIVRTFPETPPSQIATVPLLPPSSMISTINTSSSVHRSREPAEVSHQHLHQHSGSEPAGIFDQHLQQHLVTHTPPFHTALISIDTKLKALQIEPMDI